MSSSTILTDLIRALVAAEAPPPVPVPRRFELLPEIGPGEEPDPGPQTRLGRALRTAGLALRLLADGLRFLLHLLGKGIEHLPVQFLWRVPRR